MSRAAGHSHWEMGRAGYSLGRGLDAALVVGDGKTPTAMAEGAQIPSLEGGGQYAEKNH